MIQTSNRRSVVSVSTPKRELMFVNEEYQEVLGWKRHDLIGRSWEELMPSEAVQEVERPFTKFLEDKRSYSIRTRVLDCNGRVINFDARCSVLCGCIGEDLLFTEMYLIDDRDELAQAGPFGCAELVRDVTYELAALTGRSKLRELTTALIEASGKAEWVIDLLSRSSGLLKQLDR